MPQPHFLIVTFPAQGHINPALQFANRLIRIGFRVTFATSLHAKRRMTKASFPEGLSFATFSDGYDDGFKPGDDHNNYMSEIRRHGSQTLSDLIVASANEGKRFSCLVHTLLLPWAADVARAHHLPSTLLWIQPATVLGLYYYYFNGYGDLFNNCNDPSYEVKLPGLVQSFTSRDLPSFLVPSGSNPYKFVLLAFQEDLDKISEEGEEAKPIVLVNTFDALEPEALKAINKFNMIGIGPLLDLKDPSDTRFGADLFPISSISYIEWLNSKPKSSVIYVSFGSYSVLSKQQMEEIASGFLNSGRPFLWVIRDDPNKKEEKEKEELSCRDELEEKGMIVSWCNQLAVLSHPSVGCFLTHSGWNSTTESLAYGVPMVAFPQWTDQATNGKLIEDEWKSGVRVVVNKEGIVKGEEIMKCLEIVMGDGERGEEIRKNAMKWKNLASEALQEGGSSDKNLKAFVEEVLS